MSKIKSLMIFLLVIFSCTFWAATSFADNVVVKQWTEQLGTNSIDYSNGVAVDSDGNAYVTGYTFGSLDGNTSAGSSDIFLTKYNSSGVKQWTKQWGTSGYYEEGKGVAIDSAGNAYVAGYTDGSLDGNTSTGSTDIFLTKYNSSGVKQWTKQWGTGGDDWGNGVSVDSSGNAYVAGYTGGSLDGNTSTGSIDIFLTKYNSSGVKQWTKQWGTITPNEGNGVSVDSSGNAYVTGYTFGSLDGNTSAGGTDIFLTKYNSSGVKQWTKQWGTGGDDKGYGVAIDTAGNAYVTGYTFGSLDGNTNSGYRDIFLTKYNSSGVKQWTKQWGTMETISMEYCGGVAVDSSGNAYVTGCTGGSIDGNTNAGGTDIFLIKYNSSGVKQWTKQWGTSTSDEGNGVSVDSSGNAYVAGSTVGSLDGNTSAGNTDIFLTKFILRSNTGPVLLFTDEIGYQTDGVNPSNGSPSTQFTYRVLYTDADSDTPKAGYPKVYIKNNETNISGSPFTMSYVSGVNNTGAIYYFTTTLPSLSSNYSYYFEAYDIFSATATGIATQISTGPIIFSSCTILWTGEVGFENDGVNPSSGAPSGIFTYRINYINLNNDVPYSGYPKLYIKKGGTNISGSPFVLSEYNPLDTNYTDGKIYFTTVTLNATGRDYTYYFEAKDTFGIFANGAGNTETLGPYVNTPPNTSNKQPSNGVTYTRTTKNPSFSWTYSDIDQNTQSSYQLQLRTADGTYGDTNSKDTGEITSSQNSYTPTNFNLIIGKYYWRVCTKDNSGFSNAQGAYSAETSFSLDNSSPTLSWTNEDGYKQGGLNINKDNLKEYIFRVKYTDVDNDAPKTGYPKLHLKLNNTEVAGSPFTMQEVDTLNTNFIDGKIYSYTIANLVGADNYSYYFEASDIYDGSALGIACTQTSQLAIMTKPPELKSAKVYHGIFKPGNSEECYVSFNAEQQGNYTVKVYDTSGAMIRELYNGTASPGLTTIKWNGKDDSGNMVSSGVYLIHIKGVDVDVRKKVGVIR